LPSAGFVLRRCRRHLTRPSLRGDGLCPHRGEPNSSDPVPCSTISRPRRLQRGMTDTPVILEDGFARDRPHLRDNEPETQQRKSSKRRGPRFSYRGMSENLRSRSPQARTLPERRRELYRHPPGASGSKVRRSWPSAEVLPFEAGSREHLGPGRRSAPRGRLETSRLRLQFREAERLSSVEPVDERGEVSDGQDPAGRRSQGSRSVYHYDRSLPQGLCK